MLKFKKEICTIIYLLITIYHESNGWMDSNGLYTKYSFFAFERPSTNDRLLVSMSSLKHCSHCLLSVYPQYYDINRIYIIVQSNTILLDCTIIYILLITEHNRDVSPKKKKGMFAM